MDWMDNEKITIEDLKKKLESQGIITTYYTNETPDTDETSNISVPLETAIGIFKLQQKMRDIEKIAFCSFLDDENTVAAIQAILKEEK